MNDSISTPSRGHPWARLAFAWLLALSAPHSILADNSTNNPPVTVSSPQFQGGNVEIDWNSGGDLQVAPTPVGPWINVPVPAVHESRAVFPAIDLGARFYRVVDQGIPGNATPIVQGDPHKPFRVALATVRKANVSGGNCLLEVQLRPGQLAPPVIPLLQDGDVIQLRDDGTGGDAVAGDGIYSSPFTLDIGDLQAANDFFQNLPAAFQVQGTFLGRTLAEENGFNFFDMNAFNNGQAVQIFPSPFDGFLSQSQIGGNGGAAGPNGAGKNRRAMRMAGDASSGSITFITNIFTTNIVVGTNIITQTNIDCAPATIPTPPMQVVTNVCTTNFVAQPGTLLMTNVVCAKAFVTNVVAATNSVPTNVVVKPTRAGQRRDAVATDPNPGPTNAPPPVLITNIVEVDLCSTNIVTQPVDGPPVPVVSCTNAIILVPQDPVVTNQCVTNVVIVGGQPIFTNIFITNIVAITNTTGGGLIITNVDGDPIIKPNPRLPGQGGLLQRPTFFEKSLLITDLSVVEDPTRTFDPCTGRGTKMGAWTFGRLMTDIANPPLTGIDPSDFVRRWLRSWQKDQTINFDTVTNRNAEIVAQVINGWQAASGGDGKPLDLSIAPFRLLAIVNRLDLRGNPGYAGVSTDDPCVPASVAGEGRFVFCLIPNAFSGGGNPGGPPGYNGGGGNTNNGACGGGQYTVIFEYAVPKHTCAEIKAYGMEWYSLSQMQFGPVFNMALQRITDQFAAVGADPSRKPNQSALSQLRANELLREPWELREWRFFATDSDAGWLREVTVKKTPAIDYNFDPILVDFCNANAFQILLGTHDVPLQWGHPGVPFLGGGAPMATQNFFWDGPPPAGTSLPTNLRHNFSLNTCNGCHSGETGTPFTHVFPRAAGQEAQLSDFLTGKNMPKIDPADGHTQRWFADLKRREDDLLHLITEPCFFQLFKDPAPFIH